MLKATTTCIFFQISRLGRAWGLGEACCYSIWCHWDSWVWVPESLEAGSLPCPRGLPAVRTLYVSSSVVALTVLYCSVFAHMSDSLLNFELLQNIKHVLFIFALLPFGVPSIQLGTPQKLIEKPTNEWILILTKRIFFFTKSWQETIHSLFEHSWRLDFYSFARLRFY